MNKAEKEKQVPVASTGNVIRVVLIEVEEVSAAVRTMHWEIVLVSG